MSRKHSKQTSTTNVIVNNVIDAVDLLKKRIPKNVDKPLIKPIIYRKESIIIAPYSVDITPLLIASMIKGAIKGLKVVYMTNNNIYTFARNLDKCITDENYSMVNKNLSIVFVANSKRRDALSFIKGNIKNVDLLIIDTLGIVWNERLLDVNSSYWVRKQIMRELYFIGMENNIKALTMVHYIYSNSDKKVHFLLKDLSDLPWYAQPLSFVVAVDKANKGNIYNVSVSNQMIEDRIHGPLDIEVRYNNCNLYSYKKKKGVK